MLHPRLSLRRASYGRADGCVATHPLFIVNVMNNHSQDLLRHDPERP